MEDSNFTGRLRALRDERGLTVQEMAKLTGVPKKTLDKYMLKGGDTTPGLEALVKIAEGLDVSLDWLVLGVDKKEYVAALARISARKAASFVLFALIDKEYRKNEDDKINGLEEIMGKPYLELVLQIADGAWQLAREYVDKGNCEGLKSADRLDRMKTLRRLHPSVQEYEEFDKYLP